MSPKYRLFLIGGLCLLIVAGGIWFFTRDTDKDRHETIKVPSLAFKFREYVVAEHFLSFDGVHARRTHSLPNRTQLNYYDVIFLMEDAQKIERQTVDALLKWVEKGGHLIIAATGYETEPDETGNIFQTLGITLKTLEESQNIAESCPEPTASGISCFELNEVPVKIRFKKHVLLQFDSTFDDGVSAPSPVALNPAFIRLTLGEGSVSIFPDASPWRNANIDKYDHAFVLANLSKGSRKIFLSIGYRPDEYPGIISLIWQYAYEATLSFALLVGLWLFYRAKRFGPVRELPPPARRSLIEHLRAANRFRWERKHFQILLKQGVDPLNERILKRYPKCASMQPDEKIAYLAQRTALPEQTIQTALCTTAVHGKTQLLTLTSHLQTLWKKL